MSRGVFPRSGAWAWMTLMIDASKETIAKRLAGLHAFMPLLQLPWPQADPVESHLACQRGDNEWDSFPRQMKPRTAGLLVKGGEKKQL